MRLIIGVFVIVLAASLSAQTPADAKADAAFARGEAAFRSKRWTEALAAFKDANAALGKKSPEAYYGIARALHQIESFDDEIEAAKSGLKCVGTNDRLAAALHNQLGAALLSAAESNADKRVKQAEAEFRTALALPAPPFIANYNLGVALLRQHLDGEGLEKLKLFTETSPNAPEAVSARRMIDNPSRARGKFAPDFEFTTEKGETFSLKELAGKVVYLDFWGQWCGPCRAITGDLVSLYRRHRANPGFVMVGISSDSPSQEHLWRDYVRQNKMEWPQFIDLRREVIPRFGVHAFPTGIVIGGDGVILHSESGGGSGAVAAIDSAIREGLKALVLR
jgi:thiol-disulfide isomerase/thioredoxin